MILAICRLLFNSEHNYTLLFRCRKKSKHNKRDERKKNHTVFAESSQGNFISFTLAIRNDLLQFKQEITGKKNAK